MVGGLVGASRGLKDLKLDLNLVDKILDFDNERREKEPNVRIPDFCNPVKSNMISKIS